MVEREGEGGGAEREKTELRTFIVEGHLTQIKREDGGKSGGCGKRERDVEREGRERD